MHIKINEPATDWEAPNSGDGPDESWKSVIVKINNSFAEVFKRLEALEKESQPNV